MTAGVLSRVLLAREQRVVDDGRAQLVVRMVVGAAHAFVDHVGAGRDPSPSARPCRP